MSCERCPKRLNLDIKISSDVLLLATYESKELHVFFCNTCCLLFLLLIALCPRHRGLSSSWGPSSRGSPGSLWGHDLGAVPQGVKNGWKGQLWHGSASSEQIVKTDILKTATADPSQKSRAWENHPIQNEIAYCFFFTSRCLGWSPSQ